MDKQSRVASVDIMRALTMLTMLFVNDFAGMSGIPHWLHHARMYEDMLGYSDLVFPAFLFCVGLSIPFALMKRYEKGDSHLDVLSHVAIRSISLIIMGLVAMNMGGIEGGLSKSWIMLIATIAFFLIWCVYPKDANGKAPKWTWILKGIGIAILLFIIIYKDMNGKPFRVGWWGILGLIGWSYLVGSLVFVFTKGELKKVAIVWTIAMALCILNFCSFLPQGYSSKWLVLSFVPGCWANHSLCLSGILASILLMEFKKKNEDKKFILSLCSLGAIMLIVGLICHQFWIISKDQATPTWFFFCAAIFFPIFGFIYWLADVKGKTLWAKPIMPAGKMTLTCYLIPYLWYSIQQLVGLSFPPALHNGWLGLTKALIFSFVIIFLTYLFGKIKIKIKL